MTLHMLYDVPHKDGEPCFDRAKPASQHLIARISGVRDSDDVVVLCQGCNPSAPHEELTKFTLLGVCAWCGTKCHSKQGAVQVKVRELIRLARQVKNDG